MAHVNQVSLMGAIVLRLCDDGVDSITDEQLRIIGECASRISDLFRDDGD